MGASQSQEELLDTSDSEAENALEHEEESEKDSDSDEEECKTPLASSSPGNISNIHSLLDSLSIKMKRGAQGPHTAKLYRHVSGRGASESASKSQWIVAHKSVFWEFFKDDESDGEDNDISDDHKHWKSWLLLVGTQVRAPVDEKLQMKQIPEQHRVDFVYHGVWAFKFSSESEYLDFITRFGNCLFENTYMLEATESNKVKVYGKDFMCWVKPESADESIWEDAEDKFEAAVITKQDYLEDYVEAVPCGIQSLTMGALDHSFLVSSKGIETFRNMPSGIHSKGASVVFGNELGAEKNDKNDTVPTFASPKKAMLIKGESNLMVMSPTSYNKGTPYVTGVHQLDVDSGKVVAQWKFEKDGTPITMRDITNETKSAQLDSTGNSFLGLDDNRLCRWDMRARDGIVQVLDWKEGHQFSRGTNFQCFATTGDGCIAVGSKDGKIRLYGTTSMRIAKTAFPGLGSPITHIDVTYDGKWVLATTDAYLILMSTVFRDKDGVMKTGFSGRMGNSIAAPRLLKLSPIDAHLAGQNYKFQGGQFTWVTESDRQERNVVATIGKFTVVWNFRRVKDSLHECYRNMQGMKTCYCYRVIPREESIVDSKFMHDNYSSASPNAPLVVVTPQKISSISVTRE